MVLYRGVSETWSSETTSKFYISKASCRCNKMLLFVLQNKQMPTKPTYMQDITSKQHLLVKYTGTSSNSATLMSTQATCVMAIWMIQTNSMKSLNTEVLKFLTNRKSNVLGRDINGRQNEGAFLPCPNKTSS